MKRLIALAGALLCLWHAPAVGAPVDYAETVSACGTANQTYAAPQTAPLTVDPNGKACVNATVTAAATAPYVLTSTGFQQVASFSASTGFTPPATSTVCFIQAEGNSVRFRTDGIAPTATIGQLLATGNQLVETANLAGIKFIPTTGSATLDVDCYK